MSAFGKVADSRIERRFQLSAFLDSYVSRVLLAIPSVETQPHRRYSAKALAEAVSVRSVPTRAPLHTRTRPKMSSEARVQRRTLEVAVASFE